MWKWIEILMGLFNEDKKEKISNPGNTERKGSRSGKQNAGRDIENTVLPREGVGQSSTRVQNKEKVLPNENITGKGAPKRQEEPSKTSQGIKKRTNVVEKTPQTREGIGQSSTMAQDTKPKSQPAKENNFSEQQEAGKTSQGIQKRKNVVGRNAENKDRKKGHFSHKKADRKVKK